MSAPWLKYPKNKPSTANKWQEFFVAYKNPRLLTKNIYLGAQSGIPEHVFEVLTWDGQAFILSKKREITHFMPIPLIQTSGE